MTELTANVVVKGDASDPADKGVSGLYVHTVKLLRDVALSSLTQAEEGAIAKAVLDSFHNHQGIECLDDFEIEVVLPSGKQIREMEDEDLHDDTLVCSVVHDGMVETFNTSDTVTVRLTLDVTYSLNGEDAADIVSRVRNMCERAIGEGMLTGESDAIVDEYSMDAAIRPVPLGEDALADFMLHCIENGGLGLEDIPVRLARYGLMEPDAFVAEMRERIVMAKQET